MRYFKIFKKFGVLFVLAGVLGGCNMTPHYSKNGLIDFGQPSVDGSIKVMTFNVRVDFLLDGFNAWGYRKDKVVDLIADQAADVVALQEAKDYQLKYIAKALPGYAVYAVGRNNGKSSGEMCAVLYRVDRYELSDKGTFWFSDRPDKAGSKSWGSIWPRICSWTYLTDKQTNKSFYVYNLHMDPISQSAREKSVRLLVERIHGQKFNRPFFVMGDFNMELDNKAMQYLYGPSKLGVVDAWESIHKGSAVVGTRHGFSGSVKGPMIDHIAVGQFAKVYDVQIDQRSYKGRYPSDHFPVAATIQLADSLVAKR